MILFFDRSVGTGIPKALLSLKKFQLGVEYHEKHFAIDSPDDEWLPVVGAKGWFVIGHDYQYPWDGKT